MTTTNFSILILILLNCSLLIRNKVDAYQTFELVDYCERYDISKNSVRFPDETRDDDIKTSGLVVPKKLPTNLINENNFNEDYYDEDEEQMLKITNYNEYAGEMVTVNPGYDTSAIRLIVNPEHVFRARLRCSILVMPKKPNGLIVTLRKLHVRPGTDWLRISINNSSFTRTFSHIRINSERDSVAYVAHHGVLIEFGTKAYLPKSEPVEIELILTLFREADLCDIDQEFDCGSFRCISNNYLCDGFNNCGDGRDESGCPIDNITNYLIVSTAVLLAALLIFLCFCYRCCFPKNRDRHSSSYNKQYQYLRIRTNSQPTPYVPKFRSQSIQSEADLYLRRPPGSLPPLNGTVVNNNLRRVKFAHVGDSMPVLLSNQPSSSTTTTENPHSHLSPDYGSTGNTYFLPYPSYTIYGGDIRLGVLSKQFRNGGGPSSRLSLLRQQDNQSEHNTCPLPKPTYPMLHPQLFNPPPPSHTHPPPPYSLRDPSEEQAQQSSLPSSNSGNKPPADHQ